MKWEDNRVRKDL